uniref:Ribosomal RNA-processing protein 42 n=1 Tax=Polytomella parva TaxID=51329 RepID=A0A7S0UKW6_9CHLO|mmetsp:Transcript_13119/g.23298  ORF Transcript_13119/g.23298 Transcript_13119/m.23298 type:complete len:286 (+) Transcript_13119:228-1085(+)|eukprot:CAMPEP_0175057758 /NCGR_PEP_ID=MMETSP0052_2-20121109/11444_1 /TAXON_ID=51329 ORGANISM="Polytomella parva, Strain SAG 63-3" /NCGR_SAMPLE_ID=MMETSP0052_2 /ASSEMBLY_ACC=CAM_ASM_000194 /LENGTH=285 /DNA_ID=CAMNT_0016323011 /DNA_START=197 /DNA_END=1054 /DNA_ORIENTATION=+
MASPSEIAYIRECLIQNMRIDGRGAFDCRSCEFELGIVSQAAGSARLRLGSTDVIVCVKIELGHPAPITPNQGSLKVSVECSSCASPEFIGRGGDQWAAFMSQILERSLSTSSGSSGVDLTQLIVVPGKTCWRLFVDGLVLNDDGNVLDALSLAAFMALQDTRIPHVSVAAGAGGGASDDDAEPELELDDDPEHCVRLDMARVPVVVTVGLVKDHPIIDASLAEERSFETALHCAVNAQGCLCASSLSGGAGKPATAGVSPAVLGSLQEEAVKVARKYLSDLLKK